MGEACILFHQQIQTHTHTHTHARDVHSISLITHRPPIYYEIITKVHFNVKYSINKAFILRMTFNLLLCEDLSGA